jgi:tetratricopeptide (TPR) repeat protein
MINTEKVSVWLLALFAFLLPLFFLPATAEFYTFNKLTLINIFAGLMLIVWLVKIASEKKLSFKKTKFNLAVLALTISYLLTTFIQTPNKHAALAGQTGLIISLSLIFFAGVNTLNKKDLNLLIYGFVLSSAVISWLTVFSYLGLTQNLSLNWIKSKSWTPAGSPLASLTFLTVFLLPTLFWAVKTKDAAKKILLFLAATFQILGIILIIMLIKQNQFQFFYLPLNYGWQIAVEGFKSFRIAFFGVGIDNFKNAFTQFKPVDLNTTKNWAVLFNSNSSEVLNLLSTTGLLGTVSFILLLVFGLKPVNYKGRKINKIFYLLLAAAAIMFLILPANTILWSVLFLSLTSLAVLEASEEKTQTTQPYAVWTFVGLGVLLIIAIFYLRGRGWLAENSFKQSLDATQANQGINTYNLQIKAISLNPYAEEYHLTYSQTNFLLANSLASQKDISDQDKENVSLLISQSIREAKLAINLNPQTSQYWINLAGLYRNIIPVAQDAQNWAVSSYQQAIRLDPANPLLRVDFGSLFYSLKAYDQAIEQFKIAVNLKPDYANGYYNLAAAYKQKQDYLQAYLNMQAALNLIPNDSPDKAQALLELEELKELVPKDQLQQTSQQTPVQEELTAPPEAIPSPKPGFNQITLPEEAAPPETEQITLPEASPLKSPEATPSASPQN